MSGSLLDSRVASSGIWASERLTISARTARSGSVFASEGRRECGQSGHRRLLLIKAGIQPVTKPTSSKCRSGERIGNILARLVRFDEHGIARNHFDDLISRFRKEETNSCVFCEKQPAAMGHSTTQNGGAIAAQAKKRIK